MSKPSRMIPGALLVVLFMAAAALPAHAVEPTGFSLGAHAGYTKSVDSEGTVSYGGQIRFRPTAGLGIEARAWFQEDTYKIEGQDAIKAQIVPVQLSLELFLLAKSPIQIVFLGGVGWYFTDVTLDYGSAKASSSGNEFGYHVGLGAEVWLGSHFFFNGDARWVFLNIDALKDLENVYNSGFKDDFYTLSLGLNVKF